MAIFQGRTYKRNHALAIIDKGPGTKALVKRMPDQTFIFGGTVLVDSGYLELDVPREALLIDHLGDDDFVLWFEAATFPRYVERMQYNGHERIGITETWEMQLPSNATAEEKADYEDAGSMMMFPAPALWFFAFAFALLGSIGYHFGTIDRPFIGTLMFSWIGAFEFAIFAIYKADRDRFNRALDVIRALDLRCPPSGE